MNSLIIENIICNIYNVKKTKNAIILAHYYQRAEIQEIADFVGDSYALSLKAKQSDAKEIIFAGVKFMAETAKILNPEIRVLLPEPEAGCSLADSCKEEDFKEFLKDKKDHIVITYINSSIEIKALSDIICTSGNAVTIVNSVPKDKKIIFAPDKNLGRFVMEQTGREMVIWDGACHVHNQLHVLNVIKMKEKHKDALLLAHPECQGTILKIADFIGSTKQMIDYSEQSTHKEFIVATETGILHEMQKKSPDKTFHIVPENENCQCNDCNFMKMITIEKIEHSLKNNYFEIIIEEELRKKALRPIEKMIQIVESL
jgi:quinolinate synthase